MRDISNENISVQHQKTVKFKERMNNTGEIIEQEDLKYATSEKEIRENRFGNSSSLSNIPQDARMSTSPYERTMANYNIQKEKFLEADIKRMKERKEDLIRMKKERELRNSSVKSFIESNNLTSSRIQGASKSGLSPHILNFDQNTVGRVNKSPSIKDIINNDNQKSN